MEDKKMNEIMRRALETSKSGKWEPRSKFNSDEEFEMYVVTACEMERYKNKKVVWMPE